MKIDGVEFPDHVVEAFAKASGMDYPIEAFDDGEPAWFRQVMLGFLGNFYNGWKARAEHIKRGRIIQAYPKTMSSYLHAELNSWLVRMKQSGAHPTVEQLQKMVTRAGIVKRVMNEIRESLNYELS